MCFLGKAGQSLPWHSELAFGDQGATLEAVSSMWPLGAVSAMGMFLPVCLQLRPSVHSSVGEPMLLLMLTAAFLGESPCRNCRKPWWREKV